MGFLRTLPGPDPVPRPISQRLFLSIISEFCVSDGHYSKHYAYSSISLLSTSDSIHWLIPMQDKDFSHVHKRSFQTSSFQFWKSKLVPWWVILVTWKDALLPLFLVSSSLVEYFNSPLMWNENMTIPTLSCTFLPLFHNFAFLLWRLLTFAFWNHNQDLMLCS